jgi:ABC-type glycerol-3-phosphate transport system substrate-binding protein
VQNRTKVVAGVSALLTVVALTAGCSSSKSSGNSTTGASGGTAASGGAATGSFKGQSFSILGQWTGAEQTAFQSVITAFDKATGAKGNYTPAPGGDVNTVLGTKVAGGTPPDIAILSSLGAIQQYAAASKLTALASGVASAVNANYASEWATLGSVGGKLYGVPVDASDKSTVWYNAKAFSTAGISSDPATWDDFIKAAQTLSDSGVTVPISVGGGDGWTLTDWFENVYIRSAGVDMYDKLTHHQIPWTDPSVTTALNDLKQVWGNPALIGNPAAALKVPFTASVDNVFKKTPTSAIVYEASFVATTITGDKDPAVVGTDAKFFPFPSVGGSQPVLEAAGDFAVQFGTNPAAAGFLTFLAGAEAAKDLVSSPGSGFLSANKLLANSSYPDDTSKQLGQQLVTVGSNFRFDMSDQAPASFGGTPNKGEWADLQTFLGNGDVAAAQTQLEKDAVADGPWS